MLSQSDHPNNSIPVEKLSVASALGGPALALPPIISSCLPVVSGLLTFTVIPFLPFVFK